MTRKSKKKNDKKKIIRTNQLLEMNSQDCVFLFVHFFLPNGDVQSSFMYIH